MQSHQSIIIILFAILNFVLFIKGYIETRYRKNAFKTVPYVLILFGIFVWGDAVIISLFFVLTSTLSLILNDWILFLLIFSAFWLVRSLGETIYYFNQQFSKVVRQPPKKLPGFWIYQNDSIWFAYQIFVQCISVITLITTIYLAHLWLG